MKKSDIIVTILSAVSVYFTIEVYKKSEELAPSFREAIEAADPSYMSKIQERLTAPHIPGSLFPYDNLIIFGEVYKPQLIHYSKEYVIPPEMLLAIFYPEFCAQTALTESRDKFLGVSLGIESISIGLAQVTISTALDLNKYFKEPRTKEETVALLMTPEGAIKYAAMYLKYASDKLGIDSSERLLFYPEDAVRLYGSYVAGFKISDEAILNGMAVFRSLSDLSAFELFGSLDHKSRLYAAKVYEDVYKMMKDYAIVRYSQKVDSGIDNYTGALDVSPIFSPEMHPLDAIKRASDIARSNFSFLLEKKERTTKPVPEARNDPYRKFIRESRLRMPVSRTQTRKPLLYRRKV
ncbi:MAG: hypothetical protein PHU63_00475 [Candidatus ainarchaeum sp.]|nr:hypothetical protein [Candidatus ainarchaeum sp.]